MQFESEGIGDSEVETVEDVVDIEIEVGDRGTGVIDFISCPDPLIAGFDRPVLIELVSAFEHQLPVVGVTGGDLGIKRIDVIQEYRINAAIVIDHDAYARADAELLGGFIDAL